MRFYLILPSILLILSVLAAGHGSHEESVLLYSEKLKQDPGDLVARHELALAHLEHGDWRLALAELRIADRLSKPSSGVDFSLTRARALVLGGRHEGALEVLNAFLLQHPDDAAALLERARIESSLGLPAASFADYRHALALPVRFEPDLFLEVAEKMSASHLNDEATSVLQKGIQSIGAAPALVLKLQDLGGSVPELAPLAPSSIVAQASVTVNALTGSGMLTRGPYLNQSSGTGIAVRWRSSEPVVGRVCYGDSPTNLTQVTDELTAVTNHEVMLAGLTPHTRYYYSVGSADDTLATGEDETFRTSPVPGSAADTRIWVVGDCGRGTAAQKASRDAYGNWTGSRTPDLCLMLGDNAYFSGTDAEYQTNFFNIYTEMFRKMPLWSTIGNHDAKDKIAATFSGTVSNFATFPYYDIFTFPTAGECGGVPSGSECYFSFDYGNIHIINLDSQTSDRRVSEVNGTDGAMAAWLRADLASTTQTWILVMFHHPIYSKGSNDSDTVQQMVQMRTNFGPLLEAGGVDLVLTGHSHAYERSVLMDGHYGLSSTITEGMKKNAGNGRTVPIDGVAPSGTYLKPLRGPRDHFGTVYTVAGSAGAAEGGPLNHPVMAVTLNTVGTFNLDINGNTLVGTYVQSDGATPDIFTITKRGDAERDGDGIPDAYEDANGLNRSSSSDGGSADLDGDGVINLNEYILGTAANTPDQYPWTTTRDPETGAVTVSFPTLVGRTYRILCSADLLSWENGSPLMTGDGSVMSWLDSGEAPRRFYRLEVCMGEW